MSSAWVVGWLVLVLTGAVVVALAGWRLWGKCRVLMAEVAAAGDALARISAGVIAEPDRSMVSDAPSSAALGMADRGHQDSSGLPERTGVHPAGAYHDRRPAPGER